VQSLEQARREARIFGQNAASKLTGEAIVTLVDREIVPYRYVGRVGGAPGAVLADAATGAWEDTDLRGIQ
jgi:hypothetical protein